MAHLGIKEVREATAKLIEDHPGGIRFSKIYQWFRENHPETPEGTLAAQIAHVVKVYPERVTRVGRGLYAPVSGMPAPITAAPTPARANICEEDFYAPFAVYLQDDLDEVLEAVPLGGACMKTKWGTPDVVGVYRPTTKDVIKFDHEIVSAEIKVDPRESITAFGQAVSYRLFSTKSYLVMPNTITEIDKDRLDALAQLFGIGLVLFKPNPQDPEWEIRVRAQRFTPDMFYANEFANELKKAKPDAFDTIFG